MARTEKMRILPWRVVRVILLEPQRGKSGNVVSSKFFVYVAFFHPVDSSTGYNKQLAWAERVR